ncbi:MAG: hypothetical protein ACE5G5_01210 [Candidatus Methylomirabilales bacterium]
MPPSLEQALGPAMTWILKMLALPVAWILPFQAAIVGYLWDFSSPIEATIKVGLVLLPALHLIAGVWCTCISLYTLLFRGARKNFITAVFAAWWDSGRAMVMFWAGLVRALFLTAGWIWGLIRLLVAGIYLAIVELFTLPFSVVRRATQSSLRPGIPWIAVILTLGWSLLEAGIFSITLMPMVSDIAQDLVGGAPRAVIQPVLFVVVFLLISGSFAVLQMMTEAIQQENWKDIVQMVVFEVLVMFVEVVFLYRELVDAITPVLAMQSGGNVRIGIVGVLFISIMAWIGVRAMTWFLFGRYGTPTLVAIISGRGITKAPIGAKAAGETDAVSSWIRELINQVKADIGWFHSTGMLMLEAYILPPLQLIAATINFFMLFFAGRHLFPLPLKSLHAFMDTRELLKPARAEGHASGGGTIP